jgi:HK97 family phage major capsid protein
MAVQAKSRTVNEFRTRADKIRAELSDATKEFTKEEVEKRVADIATLEARANAAAGFTPEEEIVAQGSPELAGRAAPEAPAAQRAESFATAIKRYSDEVSEFFGGPNQYLLALAKRAHEPLTEPQKRVHAGIEALHRRAIIGTASDASGGEFLLPLQQVASIFAVDVELPGMAQLATRFPVSGRTLRIPYVVQDDATDTRPMAGIANVAIVGEGDEKPLREPTFAQRLLTVYKYAAYSELGDEVLADDFTGDLAPTLTKLVGGQVMNKINEDVSFDGTGSSQPLGAFHANNAAILVHNRETSMSITTGDIFGMYAKHTFGMGRSAWFINRTALPKLLALTLGSNTLVSFLPNLQGAPVMTLLGLPVFMTDLNPVLGVKGDLALGNGGFYAMALRQALTVESSIHYKFRHDLTAYRFLARAGGIPIPTATYAYKSPSGTKVAEHSPFVVLGDDASS